MDCPTTRAQAADLDAEDALSRHRDRFKLPDDVIYLDGNSLGPPPRRVMSRLQDVAGSEWAGDLVRSWNSNGWIDLPRQVAVQIAPLIGAAEDEVMVADSTSVNLFKLLVAGLKMRPGRCVVLSENGNFGTDLYVAQGVVDLLGEGAQLRVVNRRDLEGALDGGVALLMLTHVDFRTGAMHDMRCWTERAHAAGALTLWDLAHSAGAVPVDLGGCDVDFAVGCGYKYLNGGPGAPAFAFVARRHFQKLNPPLWGWMGHAAPFDFDAEYQPGNGVDRLLVGTPPVLSLAALQCGVESLADIGIEALRAKSLALTEMFMQLVEGSCGGHGLEVVTPREPECRGSQVAVRHPEAFSIMQALIEGGVIGDFREPNLMRFGFAPAYVRFVDVWDAVARLRDIMRRRLWDLPELRVRSKVT